MRSLIVCLLLAGIPWVAGARDGAIEINQARALAGGVTPDDAAGFPVTISEPGSYVLTSNLVPPAGGSGAIDVQAQGVDLHLNGFALLGPCASDCGPTGMTGITSSQPGLRIERGLIRDFPGTGILASHQAHVQDVIVARNSGLGVDLGSASTVRRVISLENGGDGINTDAAVVEHNVVLDNGLDGIECDDCTVTGNAARGNDAVGVIVRRSVVWANATYENDRGVVAYSGFVRGNAAHGSSGPDIHVDANTGYIHNNAGKPIAGGTSLGPGLNLCGSSPCP